MLKLIFITLTMLQIGSLCYANEGVELECGVFQYEDQEEDQVSCRFEIFTHDDCILIEDEEIFQCSYEIGIEGLHDGMSVWTDHDKKLYGLFPGIRERSLLDDVFIADGVIQIQFDVSVYVWSTARSLEEAREVVDKNLEPAPHTFIIELDEEVPQSTFFAIPIK